MTDRELLELAAKAAGLVVDREWQAQRDAICDPSKASLWVADGRTAWNPLRNDGDALSLAVKLRIDFTWQPAMESVIAYPTMHDTLEITEEYMEYSDNGIPVDTYRYSALRRAIVRAAAEIGKAMP